VPKSEVLCHGAVAVLKCILQTGTSVSLFLSFCCLQNVSSCPSLQESMERASATGQMRYFGTCINTVFKTGGSRQWFIQKICLVLWTFLNNSKYFLRFLVADPYNGWKPGPAPTKQNRIHLIWLGWKSESSCLSCSLWVVREGGEPFQEAAHTILKWVFKPEEAEDKPLWGTCLVSQASEEGLWMASSAKAPTCLMAK